MNSDQYNPAELALLQSFLSHMRSQPAVTPATEESRANDTQPLAITARPSAGPTQRDASPLVTSMSGSIPTRHIPAGPPAVSVSQPVASTTTPIRHSYESARLPSAPYGHPAQPNLPSMGFPSQPFLGFQNLGVNTRGQVNQQRLAASANHQTRSPRLPSRGSRRGRGPAVQPPSIRRPPKMDDCLLNMVDSTTGITVQGLRVTVKVYPPTKVRDYSVGSM